MPVVLTGDGPADMKALAVRLREADPRLRAELRRNFRAIGGPIVREVQKSVLGMRAEHYREGLREEIAGTVSASTGITRTGVRLDIVSLGSRMPEGKDTLPQHTDSAKGWNHPVFGRAEAERVAVSARRAQGPGKGRGHGRGWAWVKQWGKPRWFEGTITRSAPEARRAAQAALDDMRRRLES
jgi:hypothetical protein